jgi:O-methyltransferase involved in polyketide biosynthesis
VSHAIVLVLCSCAGDAGNYIRVKTMRILLENFLAIDSQDKQIVNLGAGHDTSFFCLQEQVIGNTQQVGVTFFELDMDEVVQSKISTIRRTSQLQRAICKPLGTQWPQGVTMGMD